MRRRQVLPGSHCFGQPDHLVGSCLALFHQVWRWVAVRDWRAGAVLCGFVAGWGPWLLFQERTVFSFYSIVFLPFMIMALTLSFGSLLGSPSDTRERRETGHRGRGLPFRRGGHVVVVLSHLDRTDHHVRAVADADVVADLGLKEIAR